MIKAFLSKIFDLFNVYLFFTKSPEVVAKVEEVVQQVVEEIEVEVQQQAKKRGRKPKNVVK